MYYVFVYLGLQSRSISFLDLFSFCVDGVSYNVGLSQWMGLGSCELPNSLRVYQSMHSFLALTNNVPNLDLVARALTNN